MTHFEPDAQTPDLWHYLKRAAAAGRPVVLYGMGNGADKVLDVCAARGIPVADCFASDGFVRGHLFHGRRVLSFSEAKDKYGAENMIVLLCFGSSRPDVLDTIRAAAAQTELYIPDLPVSGNDLFTAEFAAENRDRIAAARGLFADEDSQILFDQIIRAKLSGRMDLLEAASCGRDETWRILPAAAFRTAVDLGAYTGDSLRELLEHAPHLSSVLCMEPDARSFRKLDAFCRSLGEGARPVRAAAVNQGAWSEDTVLTFHGSGNRNASLLPNAQTKEKTVETAVAAPDNAWQSAFPDTPVDFIKYDVEGAEREALLGSRALIARDAPALLVSAYHAPADLWELPLLVHEMQPAYRLFLRRMRGVPAWDIELYAVKL